MYSIFNSLKNREIYGKSKALKYGVEKKIAANIKNDCFTESKIDFNYNLRCIGSSDHYMAVLQSNNTLSLFDIASAKIIRKYLRIVVDNENTVSTRLLVSNSGLIVYLTEVICSFSEKDSHMHIFLEGKRASVSFNKTIILDSIAVLNNRIFGLATNHLYEWDAEGQIVQSFCIKDSLAAWDFNFTLNEDCAVVTTKRKGCAKHFSVFFVNLHTNQHKNWVVDEEELNHKTAVIGSIMVLNNALIVASCQEVFIPQNSTSVHRNPNIKMLDINTGKIIHRFSPNNAVGEIQKLTANAKFIFFLNEEPAMAGHYFYCINLSTKKVIKMLQVPFCVSSTSASLYNEIAVVCCPKGNWNDGSARIDRYIIDLESMKSFMPVEYQRFPSHHAFFRANTFVNPTSYTTEKSIYCEHFDAVFQEDEEKPLMSLRTLS